MTNWPYIVAAVFVGILFSQQGIINAATARVVGTPIGAAFLSISITWGLISVVLMSTSGWSFRPAVLMSLPWWAILGGVIGIFAVAGPTIIAPVTGAAVLFACLVAGQLMGSLAVDHFGAFGMEVRPVSLMRVAGMVLVFAGALLVRNG